MTDVPADEEGKDQPTIVRIKSPSTPSYDLTPYHLSRINLLIEANKSMQATNENSNSPQTTDENAKPINWAPRNLLQFFQSPQTTCQSVWRPASS